jgi:hypothetical protein
MKPRVYIETSVISYLAARESRDILTLARQRWTQVWWDLLGTAYEGYASNLVLKEASDGDPTLASRPAI